MFKSESSFVGHEKCPQCNSKDNLGRYSDGHAWCFGCGYVEKGAAKGSTRSVEPLQQVGAGVGSQQARQKVVGPVRLPIDASVEIPSHCLNWLAAYGITRSEIIENKMLYSKIWNQLIYPIYEDEVLLAYQGRNFGRDAKRKYFTQGDIGDIIHVIGLSSGLTNEPDRGIILVEDLISAIKVGRQRPCMPLWGSNISAVNILRLKYLTKNIGVWLDPDKSMASVKYCDLARSLGMNARLIYSKKDPKDYPDEGIKEFLEVMK